MRYVNLVQNSQEWHDFRRCHIGASEAASIIGKNPYKSREDFWKEKVEGVQPFENERMLRGKRLESTALLEVEKITGLLLFPAVILHPEYDWASASLDGLDVMEKVVVEIKCPGKKTHSIAQSGKVPEIYYPQLQHQLACTGLDLALYFSFDGEKGCLLEVKRDQNYINELFKEEKLFWESIKDHIEAKI